jgi:hypothetical protein
VGFRGVSVTTESKFPRRGAAADTGVPMGIAGASYALDPTVAARGRDRTGEGP